MPKLNARGQDVCGNGGPVSVDGREIAPLGTCAQWLDDDRVIYQAGRQDIWTIETYRLSTHGYDTVSDRGCNTLAAGGGRWAAFLNGSGVYGAVQSNQGALSPAGTDGRSAAGPDGTIALVPDYQAGDRIDLVGPSGSVTATIRPAVYGLQVLGPTQAVWTGGALGLPNPLLLPGASSVRHVVTPDGHRWWIYWCDVRGLVAQPDGSFLGVVLEPRPLAFHHDAVATADGRLVVAYATGEREGVAERVVVPDVWALPRVDLLAGRPPVVVPPIIIVPPVIPEPKEPHVPNGITNAQLDTLIRERAKFPAFDDARPLQTAMTPRQTGAMLNAVCLVHAAEGLGMQAKPGGTAAILVLADGSELAIWNGLRGRDPDGTEWGQDVLIGASIGKNEPGRLTPEKIKPTDPPFVAPVPPSGVVVVPPVAVPPDPRPTEPRPPDPQPGAGDLAALAARVSELEAHPIEVVDETARALAGGKADKGGPVHVSTDKSLPWGLGRVKSTGTIDK